MMIKHPIVVAVVLSMFGAGTWIACLDGAELQGPPTTSTTSYAAGGAGSVTSLTSSSGSGGLGGAGDSGTVSEEGDSGLIEPGVFKPKGCGFLVASRPEYLGFSVSQPTVGTPATVRRVRLGLGGNVTSGALGHADPATSFAVAWQSDDNTLASDVAWGTDPNPATWLPHHRQPGVTWVTPHAGSLPDERMHEAYVCGLQPDTTYYYRVGGGPPGGEVWSDVVAFRTTPQAGPSKVTIGLTGDSRGENGDAWRMLQRHLTNLSPTLVLFSGDMINLSTDQAGWEQWLDHAWKDTDGTYLTLARVLRLDAHGNHEAHSTLFFGNVTLPQDVKAFPSYAELFYSVDVGPVHLVVLDDAWVASPTNDPGGAGTYAAVLSAWLDADLSAANANRSKVPWIVTVHHRSELSSCTHGNNTDVLAARKFFMPIWDKYQVDLNVAGHDHNYERSKPQIMSNATPVDPPAGVGGTVYVVCAGAGAPAYAPAQTSNAFTAKTHGFTSGSAVGLYGVLTVDAKSLKLEAHDLLADGSDPIFDTLTLTKP